MYEQALNALLIAIVLLSYFLVINELYADYAAIDELRLKERRMLNIIKRIPRELIDKEGMPCGEYFCIEDESLSNNGLRVEVLDLEKGIKYYYGDERDGLIITAPIIINQHLGRARIIA